MAVEPVAPPLPVRRVAVLSVSLVIVAMSLVWCFFSMRAVMGVGGACADGGAYVSAQPCPDGTWLIAVGIPLLLLAAFAGTFAALSLGAPDLLLPMWFLLFGSLGVNFLEFGFWSDPWVWGWIVCGVLFELMAFPALYVMLPVSGAPTWTPSALRSRRPSARWWWAYLALGAVGALVGYLTFQAAA